MTIELLIEELETLRARLHVRALSPAQYQSVGWAERPLRQLVDQCREEQDAQSWVEKHCRDFAPLDPRPSLPAPQPTQPLPMQTEASP